MALEKFPSSPVQVHNPVNVYNPEDNYRLDRVYTGIKLNHSGTFSEYQVSAGSRFTSYWELELAVSVISGYSFLKSFLTTVHESIS